MRESEVYIDAWTDEFISFDLEQLGKSRMFLKGVFKYDGLTRKDLP